MHNLLLFLHLAAAIFWMGGMSFTVMALRPALHAQLEPPVRLPLMVEVLRRFFVVVTISILVLLPTGVMMILEAPVGQVPRGWHVMAALGGLMMLLFGHLTMAPWKQFKAATAAADWLQAGKRMQQITLLVKINLGLGWLAIAAVLLWR
jgi:uncharacterized membrane protein